MNPFAIFSPGAPGTAPGRPSPSGAIRCAEQFGVPLEVLAFWETRYLRVLADALHYPLETDPRGLRPILQEMYGVAVRQAVDQLRAQGLSPMQTDQGELLLAREACATPANPDDADVRDWWNNYLFATAMLQALNQAELDFTLMHLAGSERLSLEQAKAQVMKRFPVYGDPDDTAWATGEDRRLHPGLFPRVAGYVRRRTETDPAAFEHDLQHFTSFNSLIRHEMRAGRLDEPGA